jgi:hypothetical protein
VKSESPQRITGEGVTSVDGTKVTIVTLTCAALATVPDLQLATHVETVGLHLGFTLKVHAYCAASFDAAVVGGAYLKGRFMPARIRNVAPTVLAWQPSAGRVHKMGKTLSVLSTFGANLQEQMNAVLRLQADGYDAFFLDPLMRAVVDRWKACPVSDAVRLLHPREAELAGFWKVQSQAMFETLVDGAPISVPSRMLELDQHRYPAAFDAVYGARAFEQLSDCAQLVTGFSTPFFFLEAPVLVTLAEVDYG